MINSKLILLSIFVTTVCFSAKAQQNFFNVVSSDITPKEKIFFQQQFNITQNSVQSNSTFSTGIGHNFEIGLNVFSVNFKSKPRLGIEQQSTEKPYNNYIMLNAQKKFDLNEQNALAIGFQQGIAIDNNLKFGGFYYLNYILKKEYIGMKIVFGLYAATNSYVGFGSRFYNDKIGLQAGMEKSIIKDKWYFQTDFISGKNSFSDLIIGTAYYISKRKVLSAGFQIPNKNSQSQKAIVVEFTILP